MNEAQGERPSAVPNRRARLERTAWLITVGALTLICLWPIWSERFPAMQDYPQHLLHARMLAIGDGDADAGSFELRLRPGPYSSFFSLVTFLSKLLPIEAAGKAALSLYILLVAWLVLRASRDAGLGDDAAPWGLLLLFPFALNQQYYLGFICYLYSLPVLFLALLDHRALMRGPPAGWLPAARRSLWALVLFFTHPLTVLLYVVLAGLQALLHWRPQRRDRLKRGVVPPLVTAAALGIWLIAYGELGEGSWTWLAPINRVIGAVACIFTGMRWFDGVDPLASAFWAGIAVLCGYTLIAARRSGTPLCNRDLLFFALTGYGVFALPFSVGLYSYVNVRLASVALFFFALYLGRLRFRGPIRVALVILVGASVMMSVIKQVRLSREIEEILPIVERIPPNARILPLIFDNDSPELDSVLFDFHIHAHDYYHVLIGGGFNPYMLQAPVHPVRYKTDDHKRAPSLYKPRSFRWRQHAAGYEYFLVRRLPGGFWAQIGRHTIPIHRSGRWVLLRRK